MNPVGLVSVIVAAVVALAFGVAFMSYRARRWRAAEMHRMEQLLRDRESALRESYLENAALAARLLAAQEGERQRIARDLHDDLSQKLAILNHDIDQLAYGPSDLPRLEPRVRAVSRFVGQIASDIHDLSHELHPSKIETLGLIAALDSLCRDISSKGGIAVVFEHRGPSVEVERQASLHLYRIAQEALHNIMKHSGAKEARVEFETAPTVLDLRVADHGCGFVPGNVKEQGLGLVSMRERVRMVGGKLVIHSSPGLGTRLGVRLPLKSDHLWNSGHRAGAA